jgi:hypothetical protein
MTIPRASILSRESTPADSLGGCRMVGYTSVHRMARPRLRGGAFLNDESQWSPTMGSDLGRLIGAQSNLTQQASLDFARMAATISASDRAAGVDEFVRKAREVAGQLPEAANQALSLKVT